MEKTKSRPTQFGIFYKDESLSSKPIFQGTEGQIAWRWNRFGIGQLDCCIQPLDPEKRDDGTEWVPVAGNLEAIHYYI